MNRNLFKMVLFALLALIMVVLPACGAPTAAPATGGNATEAAVSNEPVKLVLWSTGDDNDVKILGEAARLFMAKHPNVTVEIQPISWSDAHAKMLAAATSGTGPDIITGGLSWGIEFGKLGGMIDMKAQYPELEAEIEKIAHPQVMASIKSPEGEVYGVQWDLTTMMMYYRPDVLKEVTGSDKAPATWEEYTAALEKLQAAGKKGGLLQWGNTQWLQYFNFLYAAGGSLYDSGCTKATVNSPEGLTSLKFFADLYTKYKFPTDASPDMETGLATGDYPLGISGSWVAGGLDISHPEIAGKWALAPLPAGPSGKRTSFIGGRVMGIMSYSKNADVAMQFIRSIYTDETIAAMSAMAKSLNVVYIPPSVNYVDKIQAAPSTVDAIRVTLLDSMGPPNCLGWEESSKTLEQAIQEVILNGADPQKALDTGAAAMDAALKP